MIGGVLIIVVLLTLFVSYQNFRLEEWKREHERDRERRREEREAEEYEERLERRQQERDSPGGDDGGGTVGGPQARDARAGDDHVAHGRRVCGRGRWRLGGGGPGVRGQGAREDR